MVSGWVETLPLEPLKLSDEVETLMWACCAQTGHATRIAARGRGTNLFRTFAPE